jgi:protocatechuate 3,4-dioxygenase beta subunit
MLRETASRRRFLTLWIAGSGAVLGSGLRAQAPLPPTPACGAGPTPSQTEGPFYLPRSPRRADLTADGPGRPIALFGRVLTPACRPVPSAVVDLWHADAQGQYDERGFRFRAHQAADADGRYAFRSIRPGRYPSRTPHYHATIIVGGRRVLTTQLYLPGEPGNARDGLYTPRLLVALSDAGREAAGRFDFVVQV